MCGITGVFAENGNASIHKNNLNEAVFRLKKRGPDFQAVYADSHALLGHTRLSIIDTSTAANQPFEDLSKRYVIVFNGEIYNYREIKAELIQKGYNFKSQSDTEVLLYAYIEFGSSCLDLLNGFFAFAVYDNKEKSLFLARDRMGIKPLYYYYDNGLFIFGSELKSLMAFNIDRSINQESLYYYLQLNYIPEPYSILKTVKKLEKGHYLNVSGNAFSLRPYYNIELSPHDDISFDDAAEKMRALTMSSVKKRLVSDVPIGSFLSGGLDSSVIAFCAKQFTPELKTYSIGFKDEPLFDETRYAEQMAGHIGSDHTSFILTNDDLLSHMDEMLEYIDEPFADSSAIPVSILSKKTKDHISVALSGDGGDELLGGYNKHKAEYLSRNKSLIFHLISALSPVWKALPKSRNWHITNLFRQLEKLSAGLKLDQKDRYWLWCCFSNDKQARSWLLSDLNEGRINEMRSGFLPYFNNRSDFNQVLANDMHLVLANDMLVKVDRMSMGQSLEVRVPFLDHEIVDFIFNLPHEYKINKKHQKHLLKSAFKDDLPLNIINRKKHGFEVPLLKWFRNDLNDRINNEWLNSDHISDQGIFDSESVDMLKKQLFKKDPGDVQLDIWKMIVFQHWYKKYM